MVDARQLPNSLSDENDTLAAAIVRTARGAKWRTLVTCAVLGALGMPIGWFTSAHRVLLLSLSLAVGAFGAGALADRIIADERGNRDADRLIVTGFSIVRLASVVVGAGAAIAFLAWILFWLLGSSHLAWH